MDRVFKLVIKDDESAEIRDSKTNKLMFIIKNLPDMLRHNMDNIQDIDPSKTEH